MRQLILVMVVLIGISIGISGCSTFKTASQKIPDWLKMQKWKTQEDNVDKAINHYESGLAWEEKGDKDKAVEQYKQSLKISPRPVVYYRLGLIYASQNKTDEARTQFQKALELSPNFDDAQKELDALTPSKAATDKK